MFEVETSSSLMILTSIGSLRSVGIPCELVSRISDGFTPGFQFLISVENVNGENLLLHRFFCF
jgi:hypothetical protein